MRTYLRRLHKEVPPEEAVFKKEKEERMRLEEDIKKPIKKIFVTIMLPHCSC